MSNEDHDNDTCPNYATATRWMSAYGYCVTENKRLLTENADLKDRLDKAENQVEDLEIENDRLKAEVHRLEEIVGSDAIDRKYGMCCDASDEVARLKAEVERLTKAGDAMLKAIKVTDPILDWKIELWNAAKEGKQSNG